MPRKEFLDRASAALTQQQEAAVLATKSKLHDDDVIKTDGPKKWDALTAELNATVGKLNGLTININQHTVVLANNISAARVIVNFDSPKAYIRYQGSGNQGAFTSRVKGNELVFVADIQSFPQMAMASVQKNNPEYSIEEMAEKMLANVIGMAP